MKKSSSIFIVLLFLIDSCATTKFAEDGALVKDKKRIFYVLGGLAPITDNTVKSGEQYETRYDFIDLVILGLTGGVIYTRSIEKK